MNARALLDAVLSDPDNDVPRLVYADYRDDRGDAARAELIRAQCELARLEPWEARAAELRHRERVLLAEHGRRWYAELGELEGVHWGAFHRGFVRSVSVPTARVLVDRASELRALAPVEEVDLTEVDFLDGERTLDLPWLRGLKLSGRYEFEIERLVILLDSAMAPNLRSLDLRGLGVENPGAEAIAAASQLTRLQRLDLTNGFVGTRGVTALATAPHLAGLQHLKFSSMGSGYVEDPFVNDEGVAVMCSEASLLKNLVSLELGGWSLTDAALRTLLESQKLSQLQSVQISYARFGSEALTAGEGPGRWRSLRLVGTALSAEAIRRLCALPQTRELSFLELNGCGVKADGARALAEAPFKGRLQVLKLPDNDLGAEGGAALAKGAWPRLHTLDLKESNLGPDGVMALANGRFHALQVLALNSNHAGDEATVAMVKASWAPGLRRLNLWDNGLGPKAGRALVQLEGLTELTLTDNALDKEGVAALAQGAWPYLTDLKLRGNHCGDEGAEALLSRPFVGQLLSLDLSNNDLTGSSLTALLSARPLRLRELRLGDNRELGASVEALGQADALPSLGLLSISGLKLGSPILDRLAQSPLIQQLRRLEWWGNRESQLTHDLLRPLNWGRLGPDWLVEDEDEEEEY